MVDTTAGANPRIPAWADWSRTYGPRARLGLIVPPSNTTNETEFARFAPAGVTVHTMRTPLHLDATAPGFEDAVHADIDRAVDMLTPADPSLLIYACTAGSMLIDEAALCRHMADRTGTPAITTTGAILAALRALDIRRLAVATPYVQALNDHEQHYFEARGFAVTAVEGLGIGETPAEYRYLCRVPADVIADLAARAVAASACDGLFVSCTDLPVLPLIADLEARFGLPVVTSNQATLWHALRTLGLDDRLDGLGRLLAEH